MLYSESLHKHPAVSCVVRKRDHREMLTGVELVAVSCSLQVSVTDKLYSYIHYLWLENAPISELS